MTMCYSTGGGALVTACTAPTQLTLSANNVGFGQTATLSWSGAQGGACSGTTRARRSVCSR